MAVLVDSDVLIEVLRGRDAAIRGAWFKLSESPERDVLCSPISVAELWHGARPSEYPAVESLFRALRCIPINQAIGRIAGDCLRTYSKSHGLELGDALIAATAIAHGSHLWTRNRKHYPMRGLVFHTVAHP